ncbi:MAG TPA: fused response regulator/phosphatase [Micromonosporaceae bacterium]|nr:fused response regulator/phosphatase [Micromonosporaceae bacterium]
MTAAGDFDPFRVDRSGAEPGLHPARAAGDGALGSPERALFGAGDSGALRNPPGMPTSRGNTLLLVDDTASKRYVLGSWLRRGGYAVIEAATGTEALRRFREGGIDLVVLDVSLPDISGFEVCELIKSDPAHGTTPVIHVSAAAIQSVDRTRGLEGGADAYLVEPIDPDEMLATVAAILRYYQARLHAERLATRLADLARLSASLGATKSQRALLHEAATGATRIFGSPVTIVATATDGSRLAAVSEGPGGRVELRAAMIADQVDQPVGIRLTDEPPERWPHVAWPADDTVRVLTIRQRSDRPPLTIVVPTGATMEGAPVLTLFGQTVLSAMNTARLFDEEHDLALTLQRSMLPRTLPYVPGVELAVRYIPAGEGAEIGGDFYEVAKLDDQLIVAVGDVGGHSLHAATVMGELRHAMRAYIAEGYGPAGVLDRLNHFIARLIPGEIATMCLLSIDVTTGRTKLSNAGHPPPVVRGRDGVRLITDRSPLLGIVVRPATEVEFVLERDDTVVLYTDGLIETRTETLDESLARLIDAAESVERDLEAFATRLLADVGPAAPADDIAMVVVRRTASHRV